MRCIELKRFALSQLLFNFLFLLLVFFLPYSIDASSESSHGNQQLKDNHTEQQASNRLRNISNIIIKIERASTGECKLTDKEILRFNKYCQNNSTEVKKVASEFGYRPVYYFKLKRWCLEIINVDKFFDLE